MRARRCEAKSRARRVFPETVACYAARLRVRLIRSVRAGHPAAPRLYPSPPFRPLALFLPDSSGEKGPQRVGGGRGRCEPDCGRHRNLPADLARSGPCRPPMSEPVFPANVIVGVRVAAESLNSFTRALLPWQKNLLEPG